MKELKLELPYQQGAEVIRLQKALRELFLYKGYIDGLFEPLTKKAVLAYQKQGGLTEDGIVGPQTWAALTKSEEMLALARILWWEARGEIERGQIAVCNVVINRMRDRRWPDCIEDVIAQPHQFTSYGNRFYFKVNVPNKQQELAKRALNGEKTVPDDYFYYSRKPAKRYAKDFIKIGRHYFGRDIRD